MNGKNLLKHDIGPKFRGIVYAIIRSDINPGGDMGLRFSKILVIISLTTSSLTFGAANGLLQLKETGKAFTRVAKSSSGAVVFIKTKMDQKRSPKRHRVPRSLEDYFMERRGQRDDGSDHRRGSNPREHGPKAGQGSGFVISKDGYILTNNHVVAGASLVEVQLLDGRVLQAKIIGTDKHTDLAVLKIEADNLSILKLADSEKVEVGEWVVALGNPFGLSHSLTAGIVSAKGRSSVGIANYENFIQTDAAINPGNSGGPLINLDGDVIGMNTAIYSRSGGYMGIGFAIPANMIKKISTELINTGTISRGFLGIGIQELTREMARHFGYKGSGSKSLEGVLVSSVSPGSPAAIAGVLPGDIILKVGSISVVKIPKFRNLIASLGPDKKESLLVFRNETEKLIQFKTIRIPGEVSSIGSKGPSLDKSYGLAVSRTKRKGHGVLVINVIAGSKADLAGIRPGQVIMEINKRSIGSLEDFSRMILVSQKMGRALILIKDQGYAKYISIVS
jgi:serine protease Do